MKFTSWKERAMPNVALFVGFVTATREARKKYGDTKTPTIVHCRLVVECDVNQGLIRQFHLRFTLRHEGFALL